MKSSKLRVLFYQSIRKNSETISERFCQIKEHKFRGELLYGAVNLEKYDIEVFIPPKKSWGIGKRSMLKIALYMFFMQKHYDVIYAAYFQGLQLAILLNGLGIMRKKIVIWHHDPIIPSTSLIRNIIQRIFYRGCNKVLFFTQSLLESSRECKVCPESKMAVMPWGPDMEYFDRIRKDYVESSNGRYLMSGSDSRDFDSAIKAFSELKYEIDIYPPKDPPVGSKPVEKNYPNIHYYHLNLDMNGYKKMVEATSMCKAVLIITKPIDGRKLPSGLTSICEAIGLGKPCIITDNPYFSNELRNGGFAIFVKVGDIEGIKNAVERLESSETLRRQMSEAALSFARNHSLDNMTRHLVTVLEDIQ